MVFINREPIPPGEILQKEILKPLGITQRQLAEHIINGHRDKYLLRYHTAQQ